MRITQLLIFNRSSATSRCKREFSISNSIIRSSIHLLVELSTSDFPEDSVIRSNARILHDTESEAWEQQAHTLRVRGLSMARQPVRYSASRLRATSTLVAFVSLSNGVPRCSKDSWG